MFPVFQDRPCNDGVDLPAPPHRLPHAPTPARPRGHGGRPKHAHSPLRAVPRQDGAGLRGPLPHPPGAGGLQGGCDEDGAVKGPGLLLKNDQTLLDIVDM